MAVDRILVVDDEPFIRQNFQEALRAKRYSVLSAATLAEAEKLLKRDSVDLIFLDVRLPDGEGTELLERFSKLPDRPIIVMMSGYGSIASAVACMRNGAFDYLIKPFSIEQVTLLVKKVESYHHVLKVNQYLNHENSNTSIIGKSAVIDRLRELIRKVAPTEATVLICGENGTGKELVANEIYNLGARSQSPYIKINCAAMAESLMESEFFGHEKGSYTGATERREGRFELANGGTLLLDEISEISPRVQAKLLRVLQEREFERVGGTKTIKVDVRVIATTNRDLKKAVASGDFREDLYYRLNVFPIQMPPLRVRKEDIPLFAETFLERFSRRHGSKQRGYSQAAISALLSHNWPGNVRELQNTIERAVILAEDDGQIEAATLGLTGSFAAHEAASHNGAHPSNGNGAGEPEPSAVMPTEFGTNGNGNGNGESAFLSLEALERSHILQALRHTRGNRTQAANILKISIRTLRNKLNEYKLEGVEFPAS